MKNRTRMTLRISNRRSAIILELSRRPVALPAEVDAVVAANQDSGRLAGLYATRNEAAEQARLLLMTGDVRRVETVRRHNGRDDVLSIIGEGRRPVADDADDRLRPQHDEEGLTW